MPIPFHSFDIYFSDTPNICDYLEIFYSIFICGVCLLQVFDLYGLGLRQAFSTPNLQKELNIKVITVQQNSWTQKLPNHLINSGRYIFLIWSCPLARANAVRHLSVIYGRDLHYHDSWHFAFIFFLFDSITNIHNGIYSFPHATGWQTVYWWLSTNVHTGWSINGCDWCCS